MITIRKKWSKLGCPLIIFTVYQQFSTGGRRTPRDTPDVVKGVLKKKIMENNFGAYII